MKNQLICHVLLIVNSQGQRFIIQIYMKIGTVPALNDTCAVSDELMQIWKASQ